MRKYDSIEKRLEYHELILVNDNLADVEQTPLPQGYKFEFFNNSIKDWVTIHLNSEEFTSVEDAEKVFRDFYNDFLAELPSRCFFIVDEQTNEKVATATISPTNEFGYKCKIDWLAISKSHQGKGLAKPLLSFALKLAQKLGYNRILLHTQTHTWLAVKLYLNFGFEPLNLIENIIGWRIIKTLTNHTKLDHIKPLPESKMFHDVSVNIVSKLKVLFEQKPFTYEIWFKNGRNDVFVNDGTAHYEYKFFRNGKKLKLVAKGIKRIRY